MEEQLVQFVRVDHANYQYYSDQRVGFLKKVVTDKKAF